MMIAADVMTIGGVLADSILKIVLIDDVVIVNLATSNKDYRVWVL